ncbi:MAG: hypothetical protein Q8S84_02815 [bacterium]|nr:hypothetical protein [bacterium]
MFWKSKDNTLRQEMLEIFPEINEKIKRLEELKDQPLTPSLVRSGNNSNWEEIEKLNKELIELD